MATLFGVSGDNDTCAVQAAGGALVNGPFGTVTSVYGGDAFRQATVTGISTALITQAGADNGVILGEISYDAGKALFGGMTTTNYHGPSPDADALRRNILAYAAAGITASDVPLPAIAPLLLVGIAGVAAPDPGRLRDTLKKKGRAVGRPSPFLVRGPVGVAGAAKLWDRDAPRIHSWGLGGRTRHQTPGGGVFL
jgi:hypothetical protein